MSSAAIAAASTPRRTGSIVVELATASVSVPTPSPPLPWLELACATTPAATNARANSSFIELRAEIAAVALATFRRVELSAFKIHADRLTCGSASADAFKVNADRLWLRYGLLLRTAHVVIRRSDDVAVACPIGIATVDSAGRVSALRNTVQTLGREGRRCYVVLCYVRTQLSKSRLHSTRQAARSAAGARAQSHGRQGPRQARPHAVLAQCRRAQR